MGRAHRTNEGEEESQKERDHLEDQDIVGLIILK
jgi:hypothetical protein